MFLSTAAHAKVFNAAPEAAPPDAAPPPPIYDPADFDAPPDDPNAKRRQTPKEAAGEEQRKQEPKQEKAPAAENVDPADPDDATPALAPDARDPAADDARGPKAAVPKTMPETADPYAPKEQQESIKIPTSQTRETPGGLRPANAPRPDTAKVALWQAGIGGGALLLGAGPLLFLSYCTLGTFGCLVWPALQGALVTWVGNGVSKQSKGFLIPAAAGLVTQLSTVMLVVGLAALLPGVGPLVPPLPGVDPVLLVYPITLLLLLSPAIAAAASITAWHFDVEGAYRDDAWSQLPPALTVPQAAPDGTQRTPFSALPRRHTAMRF